MGQIIEEMNKKVVILIFLVLLVLFTYMSFSLVPPKNGIKLLADIPIRALVIGGFLLMSGVVVYICLFMALLNSLGN